MNSFRKFFARILRKAATLVDVETSAHRRMKLPDAWDKFLGHLTAHNPGFLQRGNVACFDFAIRNLPSQGAVVEIGSFCGLSTNALVYLKRKHHCTAPLFAADPWSYPPTPLFPHVGNEANMTNQGRPQECHAVPDSLVERIGITHQELRAFTIDSFRRNVAFFARGDLPFALEATSDEFFDLWRSGRPTTDVFGRDAPLGGPIGFCYIDGNHSYENSRRDFLNTDEKLVPGGFILFDDSRDGGGWEVNRLMPELLQNVDYKLITKNPNYFFQKRDRSGG